MSTLITIAAFTNPLEAHIAKGRLEAEDIPAFLAHEQQIWNQWHMSNALGGIRLQVLAQDEFAAREILKSHIDGDYEKYLAEEDSQTAQNCCPHCNATQVTSHFSYSLVTLLLLTCGLFGLIFPVRKNTYKCSNCRHSWKL